MNNEKNILVTGNKGFVGTNLTDYFRKARYSVVGITRKPKDNNEIDYNHLNFEVWNNALAVVHLAGKAHDLKDVANDNEYFQVNTELTKRLFNQFLKSNCEVFIYMSSVKAVADTVENILTEECEPNPLTAYGKSKRAAEKYLLAQKLLNNKKLYILRPCMIHGSGNKGNLNLLYQLIKKGIPYPLGTFDNKRSFLSVENLCFIIAHLIEQKPGSGIYNLADDEAISTNKLVKIIGEASGRKPKIWKFPKVIIVSLAKIGTFLKLPFNSEKIQKLTEDYVVSNSKIKKTLGIQFPTNTREGLMKTIKSFQNR
ncbi:MAG: nucleoside-diphosphate-sugar epimerase [Lutibacter sp.]|nr:MAG: nucleoside-diphosphate-sugar epimerase [Lutibacter sp.]